MDFKSTVLALSEANEAFSLDTVAYAMYGSMDGVDEDTAIALDNELTKQVIKYADSVDIDSILIGHTDASSLATAISNGEENDVELDAIKFVEDEVEEDSAMPHRKSGYKRVLVVRGGKKVWINKRNPYKKVILSPAQRRALAKARLKAHTSKANLHREKSLRARKRYFN